MNSRREIFEAHYRRYQGAGKKDKGKILDEAAGTTGLNRDYLAHVLSSYGKKQAAKPEARPNQALRGFSPSSSFPGIALPRYLITTGGVREDGL
jgi:hypothetical protein